MKQQPTGFVSESTLRVRYAETDAMGIVHHSRYIPWFEVGRIDFLRELGFPYSRVEELGYYFLITELGVRYHRPAHFDQVITVRTWVEKIYSRGMRLAYEISDDSGQTLVTGFTRFICANRQGQPVRLPPDLLHLLSP